MGSPWPRGTVVVACGGRMRKGLVDHATTAFLEACGDAVLTGATLTNANDLVIIAIR